MTTEVLDRVKDICRGKCSENEPMSRHTSFKIGGPAAVAAFPSSQDELEKLVKLCENEKHIVVGNGSNIVFPDRGYDGVVIFTSCINECTAEEKDGYVYVACGAGLSLTSLTSYTKKNSLSGLEFACGIPGSVGGAVYMNAGAYGGEISDVLYAVKCIGNDGYSPIDKSEFSYRKTPYMNGKIICSAVFGLKHGDKYEISERMNENLRRRREKQPLEYPSAGSFFKRPEGNFAGKLIEDAGLKGFTIGGAQVSQKHAGFIINKNNATADDVAALAEHIKETVYEKFGVMLECEVGFVDREV